ncbi:dTDP-4-amino-4,6-dideoxygalactose transaminase [Candidatus Pseudothioglobus sp. Uisw_050_01]|uniref:dTDP-4-amino-4,6-dideoxygalactose transaminase n=1 Tax=Candidatus Pseudothioglobus sp. Uisw_050_01 TaxID=3230997 RepID=UPI003A83AB55
MPNNRVINFNEPYISGDEEKYIKDVFERNSFYGNGYYTQECQKIIKDRVGAKNVLLTDSCTSALEMAALLLRDWDYEQEVILPSYTFTSTAAAFAKVGFKIIFAEINPHTMMLDIDDVTKKLTNRTTAIIIVHYGGFGASAELFKELCDGKSIYLIEDAAQAYGSKENDRHLGTIGDLGCFSFHETKNLHAGLSGALVINNEKFNQRAMHILERGTNRQEVLKGLEDKYSWVEIGGSFYPTELQAAFLFPQLKSFEKNLIKREEIFLGYYEAFLNQNFKNLHFHKVKADSKINYHAFWLIFASIEECNFVRTSLLDNNINAYIGYVPLHSSKVGIKMGYSKEDLKLTQEYSERLLRLPLHHNMIKEDSLMISQMIIKLLIEYRL